MAAMTGRQIAEEICKHFESCHLESYIFPGEENLQATIGWGTAIPLSQHPKKITQAEADRLLKDGLDRRDIELKKQLGETIYNMLTPGQHGATLSFKYNCKAYKFNNSTFLSQLKTKRFQLAGQELKKWVYGSGRKLPGLIRRRRVEEYVYFGASIEDVKKKNWFMS